MLKEQGLVPRLASCPVRTCFLRREHLVLYKQFKGKAASSLTAQPLSLPIATPGNDK